MCVIAPVKWQELANPGWVEALILLLFCRMCKADMYI